MIIFDLLHFEEAVAEAPSIVGGKGVNISADITTVLQNIQYSSYEEIIQPGVAAKAVTGSGITSTGEKVNFAQAKSSSVG